MKRRRQSKGFTLVECLVSIIILTVGLLGAVQCLNAAYFLQVRSARTALATSIAQNAMENMRNQSFPAVGTTTRTLEEYLIEDEDDLSEEVKQHIRDDILPRFPNGAITVNVAEPPSGMGSQTVRNRLRHVTIEVSWLTVNQVHDNIVLDTLLSNRVGYKG